MDRGTVITLAYLLASVLFILGIKGLTHPRTAVRGNLLGALGMLIAIVATLIHWSIIEYHWIILGLVVGAVIGAVLALKVKMTAMPQMVALLNGFGGGASVLVAGAELTRTPPAPYSDALIATYASAVIGAVTFWGSLLAFAKLEEYRAFRQPIRYPLLQPINAVLGLLALALCVIGIGQPQYIGLYWG
ncbi:MAG TPA: NAD(P)(+) transhydrogenase (Re/Si-specific) subunit beta, partial [Thermogutta sp.]|nr:NAD(P)(+) transhydrogenase (Re/Si-specific) subunit beta [Thermogutta sp.]